MLLAEFYNQILTEADVFDPLCPDPNKAGCSTVLQKWIKEMDDDMSYSNPGINHLPFLERLGRDIINDNIIVGNFQTPLLSYKPNPHGKDPDWVKQKPPGTIFTVNEKVLTLLQNELFDLFIPDEGDPTTHANFNKFYNLVKSPDKLDPDIKNKLVPIRNKYQDGKYDLPGLKKAMEVMTQLGAQKWKYDDAERQRVETEAPIIMKFTNGMMWVRLDSKFEMEREGAMMQNCISGYCPVGEQEDLTLGLRDLYAREMDGEPGTDDDAFEWLLEWLEENDTDVQDYLMNQLEDANVEAQLWDDVMAMDEEEAFDWMLEHILDADTDPETGELSGGHLIYSLRDKNGESHISAEYDPDVDMSYIEPEEALGKQNEPAVDKYKPYIKSLNNFFAEHPETFGSKGNTKDMPFHPDYDDDREHGSDNDEHGSDNDEDDSWIDSYDDERKAREQMARGIPQRG